MTLILLRLIFSYKYIRAFFKRVSFCGERKGSQGKGLRLHDREILFVDSASEGRSKQIFNGEEFQGFTVYSGNGLCKFLSELCQEK